MCENPRILKCAVFGCESNEKNAKVYHSFPKNVTIATKWKETLNLSEYPISLLQTKFMVCGEHFNKDDYKNHVECERMGLKLQLKENAVPTLFNNSELQDQETNEDALGKTLQVPQINNIMQGSNLSTASTTGTDICILDTGKSQYETEQTLIFETPIDFTILNAPNTFLKSGLLQDMKRCHIIDNMDESTEVLLTQSNGFNILGECKYARQQPESGNSAGVSGTDSDVEVLMSEEVIDSDWSAEAVGTEDTLDDNGLQSNQQHMDGYVEEHFYGTKPSGESISTKEPNLESATDISVEEFSHSCSLGVEASDEVFDALTMARPCESMSRKELLNIIKDQAERIEQLEAVIEKLEAAHNNFFRHVDGLRQELSETKPICAISQQQPLDV